MSIVDDLLDIDWNLLTRALASMERDLMDRDSGIDRDPLAEWTGIQIANERNKLGKALERLKAERDARDTEDKSDAQGGASDGAVL